VTATTSTSSWATYGVADTDLAAAVTPAVASAVPVVRSAFTGHAVHAWPDGQNGAFVVIDDLDLGPNWMTTHTWLGFMISYLHPDADCYPHYVRSDLCRAASLPLKAPFHPDRAFAGVPAVMVSRASRRRDPSVDSPARKALGVLEFIRGQS
jgi:hypothetical protein